MSSKDQKSPNAKEIDQIQKRYKKYNLSGVETLAIADTPYELLYSPTEKIPTIIVDNFPKLGKLAALRFIEWVQENPDGVISLPTRKTPEHFIKWVQHYLRNWDNKDTAKDLENNGIKITLKPAMKNLHFVQIDEFYPMNPNQHNSFNYYVQKFYLKGFGLDHKKALLLDCSKIGSTPENPALKVFESKKVDLSLRYRKPKNYLEVLQKRAVELVDQFCTDYEEKIRQLGGIGFFLGGIGPDGHIGFNVAGSDHYSTTRLTHTNYETEAAAAGDLGGIEVSRGRLVITIGLNTITYNKNATAIIIAAGEAKSGIVANSIESEKSIAYPASVLQRLPNARFYITRGAATGLNERAAVDLDLSETLSHEQIDRIVINTSFNANKPIMELSEADFKNEPFGRIFLKKASSNWKSLKEATIGRIQHNLNEGLHYHENKTFLHTAPHHDDIMLGYLAHIQDLIVNPTNKHHFAYMTSGFTAVTNSYVCGLLETMLKYINDGYFAPLLNTDYFDSKNMDAKNTEAMMYLDGVARGWTTLKKEGHSRRMLRNIMLVLEDDNIDNIKERTEELINYFNTQYPGKKDLPYIQQLKGMVREWEADLVWAYFGFTTDSVSHLRLGFYKGDIFTEEPTMERDVPPILNLLNQVKPDYVSLALDPEGSGPDTHYKVLQATAHALKIYEEQTGRKDIRVLGYRNVWFKYHPCEANMYIPVSLSKLAVLEDSFLEAFAS
ncbi:glucosamine-6-phosphate deaminase, partial [bacterium]|nr:glucosamine-6-phosphate deaminase [bacterium]